MMKTDELKLNHKNQEKFNYLIIRKNQSDKNADPNKRSQC